MQVNLMVLSLLIVSCSSRSGLLVPRPPQEVAQPPAQDQTSDNPRALPPLELLSPSPSLSSSASRLKLLWVSLDGFKREEVLKYSATLKSPHPKGFQFLLGAGKYTAPVAVSNPTITSSSHASTITCATAGTHGIFANGQWNGQAMVSGFDTPYPTETFVHALRKSGLKVGVLGYPGFDAKTENRTADFSVGYDSSSSKPQFLQFAPLASESVSKSRELPGGFVATHSTAISLSSRVQPDLKYTGTVLLHSTSGRALVDFGAAGKFELQAGTWRDLAIQNSVQKERIALRLFQKEGSPVPQLYVGPNSLNAVNPPSLLEEFDRQGLVFSSGKDFRVRTEFGDQAFLETMEQRLNYFGAAAQRMLSQNESDVLFVYLEDLDVLGHQYAGDESSFGLRSEYFAKIDQTLGNVMELVPDSADVLIVGDHGMSAIDYELSANALLPQSAKGQFVVKASGGSLFLYGTAPDSLTQDAPVDAPWFKETVKALVEWPLPSDTHQKLFGKVVVKGSDLAKKEGWKPGTPVPWIAAYAKPTVGLKETVEQGLLASRRKGVQMPPELLANAVGGDASKLGEPVPYGQHGHESTSSEMQTSVILFGPRLSNAAAKKQRASRASGLGTMQNTELVPFVADAMQFPRPEACKKQQ